MAEKMVREYICPQCGSDESVGAGSYLTKKWGNRPRRKCKRCATTFYAPIEKQAGGNE